ncbi:MAG: HEPN domain-containing protein [Burkholderiaceae bacterium]|nr:HEPN domain-containing protein [Burkholderiaceae bacterium]
MALAYLEVGKWAADSDSQLKDTGDYGNAVAYQALHAVELFLKYMIHKKTGSFPHTHKLSDLETNCSALYLGEKFKLVHPFDFRSCETSMENVGEEDRLRRHLNEFSPDYMSQHLRYPTGGKIGGHSFALESNCFDDLKARMLFISALGL